ncbi:MAG: hypothetical protein P1V51_22355 [Deltaproteobacteria bacterium]|nr:hypothetical protein [Deltaproteobacteria bacterium]
MATIGSDNPTIADWVKFIDPKGAPARVVEKLAQENPLVEIMTAKEGNLPTGHRVSARNALPSLGWREINGGVAPSKSRRETIDESCGILQGYSQVDEDRGFMQAMANEVETGFAYFSTSVTPSKFHGLIPRLDALSDAQVVAGDPSPSGADQASILLCVFAPDTVYSVFPNGSSAGITHEDRGLQTIDDGSGGKYDAWVTKWKWKIGLVVENKNYIARACNIDVSQLKADASSGTDLLDLLTVLHDTVKSTRVGRPAYFMPKSVKTMVQRQAQKKQSNLLDWIDRGGQQVATWLGIPMYVSDGMTTSEAIVS